MTEPEWAWCEVGREDAHGPFLSRKEAVEDMEDYYADYEITCYSAALGHAKWAQPEDYLLDQLGDHLGHMDELAADDTFGWFEDHIFDVRDASAAQAELTELLTTWARKHVTSNCWNFDEVERIDHFPGDETQK